MIPRISNPAEIAEVEGVGWNPETLQHNDVHRWCDLSTTQPFRRPHGTEREVEVERAARQEKRRHVIFVVCLSLSMWPPLYSGMGEHQPLHQGTLGRRQEETRRWPR
jgi:hypothetical protein